MMGPFTDIYGTVAGVDLELGQAAVLHLQGTRLELAPCPVTYTPPMSFAQALDVASLATPTPKLAHDALQVLRTKLAATLYLLDAVREATGTHCTLADLADVVADLRVKAVR